MPLADSHERLEQEMSTTCTASPDENDPREGDWEVGSPDSPPESLATTLNRLTEFYRRFVYHPDESTYDLCALWTAHTHAMSKWRATPRLFIVAPEPGCGKSTQAEVLKFGSRAGIRAGTTSAAGLFTIVTTRTVFLDETDNLFTSHPERKVLAAIINDGYLPDGFVLRKTGPIPVYGALAFAGIENGRMPEPTRQRCIPVRMRAGRPAEAFDPYDHIDYAREVQHRLTAAARSWEYIKPKSVDRNNQIWSPLHSVAAAAGKDWPERARRAKEVHQWPTESNEQKAVLAATREYFTQHRTERVASSVLAEHISADDRLPDVKPKGLAARMKGYGVTPRKSSHMYYYKADLAPAWDEWLGQERHLSVSTA